MYAGMDLYTDTDIGIDMFLISPRKGLSIETLFELSIELF